MEIDSLKIFKKNSKHLFKNLLLNEGRGRRDESLGKNGRIGFVYDDCCSLSNKDNLSFKRCCC